MGKAFNADVHSLVEKFLFNLFNKYPFSSSPMVGIIGLLLLLLPPAPLFLLLLLALLYQADVTCHVLW